MAVPLAAGVTLGIGQDSLHIEGSDFSLSPSAQTRATTTASLYDSVFAAQGFHTIGLRRHAGMLEVRIDGVSRAMAADSAVLEGMSPPGESVGEWGSDFAEIQVLQGDVSDDDIAGVEACLKWKYATP